MKAPAIGCVAFLLACLALGLTPLAAEPAIPFDSASRGFFRIVNVAPGKPLKARAVNRDRLIFKRVVEQPTPESEVAVKDLPNGTIVFGTGNIFTGQQTKWYEVMAGEVDAYGWLSIDHFIGWLPATNLQRHKVLTLPHTTLPRSARCGGNEAEWTLDWDDHQWEFRRIRNSRWVKTVVRSDTTGASKPEYSPDIPNILQFRDKQSGVSIKVTLALETYASNPWSTGEYYASVTGAETDGSLYTSDPGECRPDQKAIVPGD